MRKLFQKTYLLNSKHWLKKTSNLVNSNIVNSKNILICGGETVKSIYQNIDKKKIIKKNFILGDERDVNLKSKYSNYNNIKKNLFANKINKKDFIFFDIEKNKSKKKILKEFNNKLPKVIDLSILSFADDGHVLSLFFNDKNFKKKNNKSFFLIRRKKFSRFSISIDIFNSIKFHIILCKNIRCYKFFDFQRRMKEGIFKYTKLDERSYIVCVKK